MRAHVSRARAHEARKDIKRAIFQKLPNEVLVNHRLSADQRYIDDSQSANSKSQLIGISDLPAGRAIGKHARNVTQTAERVIRCGYANVIDLCFDERSKSVNWPRIIFSRFIKY